MATNFKELCLNDIDEARFMAEAEQSFKKLQSQMIKYAKAHGIAARKAKGKLIIEIVLHCDKPEEMAMTVEAGMKMTMPQAPKRYSVAMGNESQTDGEALFVRASGGSESHPNQGVLSTQDGRTTRIEGGRIIKIATGEDLGPAPAQ